MWKLPLMQKLVIEPTHNTPGIILSPGERIFSIEGMSAPEDVRTIYYPVLEWMKEFNREVQEGSQKTFTEEDPLILKIDLNYFNSASAKFLFDILLEFKELSDAGVPVVTEWHYEEDDTDMMEAGEDIAEMIEIRLKFMPKPPDA